MSTAVKLQNNITEASLNSTILGYESTGQRVTQIGVGYTADNKAKLYNYLEWTFDGNSFHPLQIKVFPSGTLLNQAEAFLDSILSKGAEVIGFTDFFLEGTKLQILAYRVDPNSLINPDRNLTIEGKVSTFGGPSDTGVGPNEGLAIFEKSETHLLPPDFFYTEAEAGYRGLAKRLKNNDKYYLAARWNYNVTPRSFLQTVEVEVSNPANGRSALARVVDWGPHKDTNRHLDLSDALASNLGLNTNDVAVAKVPTGDLFIKTDNYNDPPTSTHADFQSLIDALKLSHFKANELLVNTNNTGNTVPPKAFWHNIVPTIVILDQLREHFGKPVRVTSGYRNQTYNSRIGGKSKSQHLEFRALDFQCDAVPPSTLASYLMSLRGSQFHVPFELKPTTEGRSPFSAAGLNIQATPNGSSFHFRGGISAYSNFVHVDTRGVDAHW